MFVGDHAHYSVAKIAEIADLEQVKIKAMQDGSMDLDDFAKRLGSLQVEKGPLNILVLATYGTT